jgi:hypothetical protein
MQKRLARPEKFRISLRHGSGGTPLPLPSRRLWPLKLFLLVLFFIMAAIAWAQIGSMRGRKIQDVFDLAFFLFQGFWVVGWSTGVFVLGAITFIVVFYRESARLYDGRLIKMPRLGPLVMISEYDLAKIRNLRLESAGGKSEDSVRIRFDYRDGATGLGDAMPRADAEKLVAIIREGASPALRVAAEESATPAMPEPRPASSAVLAGSSPDQDPPPPLQPFSAIALIAANLVPIFGVLVLGWNLSDVMVLYWAESAVVGFWSVAKLVVVEKWAALVTAPYFVGGFGGFMSCHFLFIYYFFVRGLDAAGPEPFVWDALLDLFVPLRLALALLFISHGVSFFTNFLGRGEYLDTDRKRLMSEPYTRIFVMHLTIIFGGFVTMLLRAPAAGVILLIALKTAADLLGHRKQHARYGRSDA